MIAKRLHLIVAVGLAVQSLLHPAGADPSPTPGLEISAVQTTPEGQVSLVAALTSTGSAPLTAVTVTAGGHVVASSAKPVLAETSAIALVLDGSADGAAALHQGGLAGAAGFLLQLRVSSQTTVIADRQPAPEVVAQPAAGVTQAVQAVNDMRSGGARATSAALTLALRQLPSWPQSQRVIVLYTAATDAGGEAADALGERLRGAHAVLAVITAGGESAYWRRAASLTGGLSITATPSRAITAFDATVSRLRAHYVLSFSRPAAAVSQASVRFEVGGRAFTAQVALPPAAAAPEQQVAPTKPGAVAAASPPARGTSSGGGWGWWWTVAGVAAIMVLLVVALYVFGSRRRRDAQRPNRPPQDDAFVEQPVTAETAEPVEAGPATEPTPDDVAELAAQRALAEIERQWAVQLPDLEPVILLWTAAAASLAGAETTEQADALLCLIPSLDGDAAQPVREQLRRWWADDVEGALLFNPLGPPWLTQHLVERALLAMDERAEEFVGALLQLGYDDQVARVVDFLTRARANHPHVKRAAEPALARNFTAVAGRVAESVDKSTLADAVIESYDAELLELLPVRRETSSACRQLADAAAREQNRAPYTRVLLNAALRIDLALSAAGPAAEHQGDVAADRLRLADLDRDQGSVAEAESGYAGALEVFEELARRDTDNPARWRDVAVVHTRMADLDRDGGWLAQAEAGYRRALTAFQQTVQLDGGDPARRHDLAVAHTRLADLEYAAGWTTRAEDAYRQALDSFEDVARLAPSNPAHRREVAAMHLRLAELDATRGKTAAALTGFRRYLDLVSELHDGDPTNHEYQDDVTLGQKRLDDLSG